MLPTSITAAATREPSAACVHTIVPTRTSVMRTTPFGVAIMVLAARQMGQFGAPVAVREPTVTTPSTRTVPPTISYAAVPPFDCTRYWNAYCCPLHVSVRTNARSSFHHR